MSYLKALYDTYNNNSEKVGEIDSKLIGKKEIEYSLLPISHTTQTAHIEVIVDQEGNFYDARVLEKESTILPFTEESGSRSGKNYVPHVLHDKLMYVAGDYVKYTDQEDKKEAFERYIQQLQEWCDSPYKHEDVVAIYKYVKKGCLIKDLVSNEILFLNNNEKLLKKWDAKSDQPKPRIFSVIAGDQESALVRFNVHRPEITEKNVWNNQEIYQSFVDFYNTRLKENDICYVSGEIAPIVERHPNKLRNSGDKSKLISANDSSGFTFRGRFSKPTEVANISYEVSQKAHNALKWLIDKQGKIVDGRVFLVWGTQSTDIPQVTEELTESSISFISNFIEPPKVKSTGGTKLALARKHNQLLSGYDKEIQINEGSDNVYILTLDAATPGRLAVLYYRNLDLNEYFERLREWHKGCSWYHRQRVNNEWTEFYGAPSFSVIAHAAYGPKPSEKLVKEIMERLIPCVIDGRKVPLDIVRNAIQRASSPLSFGETWEWERSLTVACSLVKKHYEKEEYTVSLNKDTTDRSYLFGRLLAVADVLERSVLSSEDKNRATNAVRYMNAFVRQPERVWKTIHANIQPHLMRLGGNARRYTDLLDEINNKFKIEEFNNKPLDGKYLLGYYSQRKEFYTKASELNKGDE